MKISQVLKNKNEAQRFLQFFISQKRFESNALHFACKYTYLFLNNQNLELFLSLKFPAPSPKKHTLKPSPEVTKNKRPSVNKYNQRSRKLPDSDPARTRLVPKSYQVRLLRNEEKANLERLWGQWLY